MSPKQLRSGFTTGACAAAAAKAAVLAWLGQPAEIAEVLSPQGRSITVPIAASEAWENGGSASVIKDAGDDPDITNGVIITTEVKVTSEPGVVIKAGVGVGMVTKPGLSVAVGEPAVNPGPREMIDKAVCEVLPTGKGAEIVISIPDGERLAARTLNPILGITGGLSIIGTTGIVEPMSEEAFKNSLTPQISVIKALGYTKVIFVPGKIGQTIAIERYGLPAQCIVQTSNFVGHMLESAVELGMKEVLLFGHLGKLVKVAAGIFHTHNRMADARLETMAAYAAACGASQDAVEGILAATTTEAAMPILAATGLAERVYRRIAERASLRAERYVFGELMVGTVIVTLTGEILGLDNNASTIGGSFGWNIK